MQRAPACRRTAVEQKPWEVDKRWPDPSGLKNREVTPEIQEQYGGMYVAWSRDGLRVLDGDVDEAVLYEKMRRAGVNSLEFVVDYVERPGESNW
jgi:hypothetical protein